MPVLAVYFLVLAVLASGMFGYTLAHLREISERGNL